MFNKKPQQQDKEPSNQQKFEKRFAKELENDDRALISITERIVTDALDIGASDVHLEPQEEGPDVLIRYRVDGQMRSAGNIPEEHYDAIANRIKIQARLHIDDRYALQDGAFRLHHKDQIVDIRVSIVPTVNGEKINLHLLAEPSTPFALDNIGLSESDAEGVSKALNMPSGMIIVSGPTGAGKTSTLYSILKILNKPDNHIISIEDPVEYILSGTNQIQVNPEKNITFSHGLRSILRQDPNIILVGEVRDPDTAEIAVSAALSGHQLLTSIHAIDSASTIPRLLEMGVEPFILASTLRLIISQRLVRRLCEHCRTARTMSLEDIEKEYPTAAPFFENESFEFHFPAGCPQCQNTGYSGRVGIFELLFMNRELQELILSRPALHHIWDETKRQRSRTIFEDGLAKAVQGITSLEEVIRVAPPANH